MSGWSLLCTRLHGVACLHFLKPGDFADISIFQGIALCSKCRVAECLCKGLHKRVEKVKVQG
jgi:hypothetical protein